MPVTRVRDIDVYYETAGDGPPVLLISGTGGDLRNTPLSANPLVDRFSVIAYDQRGLGRSGKPDRPYTMADYADDAAALLDALEVERAHVLGVSFGGMVAQNLGVRHGRRIDRLVLACTSPGGPLPSADLLALATLSEAERAAAYVPLLDTRVRPGEPLPAGLAPILEMMARRRPVTEPADRAGALRQLEARAGHDVYDALPGIGTETLVIGGRSDGIAPVTNLEVIADRMPNARLAVCDGGHLFLLQDPTAWPTIIAFLLGDAG